jgi:hypothetical protein
MIKNLLLFTILTITPFCSCNKSNKNIRFPLASDYGFDSKLLEDAFNDMKGVEGAISLIVC